MKIRSIISTANENFSALSRARSRNLVRAFSRPIERDRALSPASPYIIHGVDSRRERGSSSRHDRAITCNFSHFFRNHLSENHGKTRRDPVIVASRAASSGAPRSIKFDTGNRVRGGSSTWLTGALPPESRLSPSPPSSARRRLAPKVAASI